MGAVKVAYYAAVENDPRVAAVMSGVARSPVLLLLPGISRRRRVPRQSGNRRPHGSGGKVPWICSTWTFPIKEMFSAMAYIDKHGPLERYNIIHARAEDSHRRSSCWPAPWKPTPACWTCPRT